jgi:hypothetical protein
VFRDMTSFYADDSQAKKDAGLLCEREQRRIEARRAMEQEAEPSSSQTASVVTLDPQVTSEIIKSVLQHLSAGTQGSLLPPGPATAGQGATGSSATDVVGEAKRSSKSVKRKKQKSKSSSLKRATIAEDPLPDSVPPLREALDQDVPAPTPKGLLERKRWFQEHPLRSMFDARSVLDRSAYSARSSLDVSFDRSRSGDGRDSIVGSRPFGHSSPEASGVSHRTGAPDDQAPPRSARAGPSGLATVSSAMAKANDRSDRTGVDRDHDSDPSDDDLDRAEGSNFRWALEAVAKRMGLEHDPPKPSCGTGRFAVLPQQQPIRLPVSAPLVASFTRINRTVTARKEVARTEANFPNARVKPASVEIYRSLGGQSFQTAVPADDPQVGLLKRKSGAVWSAYLKKARLHSWQIIAHQQLGQLSMADHLTTLIQEFVDDADMPEDDRLGLQAALNVQARVLSAAQRGAATLGSHLDLTAREAELRTLDLTEVDVAELRTKPLFSGFTFGDLPRSEVITMRENRRDEEFARPTSKAAPTPAKKAKLSKQGKQPVAQAAPFVPAPVRTARAPPPQGEGKGKGGRFKKKYTSKK